MTIDEYENLEPSQREELHITYGNFDEINREVKFYEWLKTANIDEL